MNELEKTELEELNIIPEKRDYEEELLSIIRTKPQKEIKELLFDYHDYDIASVIPLLTSDERIKLYRTLGIDAVSNVFAYLEDAAEYLAEVEIEKAADIIESMDADDALDVLEELSETQKQEILSLMDEDAQEDIKLLDSIDDDRIGSKMTTNFVSILNTSTVKQAMRSLIRQAADNDNIATIYVVDENDVFYGAIELRDLVVARDNTPLEDIISTNYPYLYANEYTADCIERLKDYSEDSIPVLNENNVLIGVITSSDVVEAATEELADDYAKFAGLTTEEDLDEPLKKSIAKRIPWLIILLGLGMLVAGVIGLFQNLIPTSLII